MCSDKPRGLPGHNEKTYVCKTDVPGCVGLNPEQGSLASGLVASFRPDFEFVGFFAVLHRDDDLLAVTGFMQEVDVEAPQAL